MKQRVVSHQRGRQVQQCCQSSSHDFWTAKRKERTYVMVVSYDGTELCGFQLQSPGRVERTVAADLLHMLTTLLQVEARSLCLSASGRTDKGVHARRQYVQFFINRELENIERIHTRMNTLLPHDICVLAVREVPGTFSVRFDALSREYHYWLQYGGVHDPLRRRYVGFVKGDLDVSAMEELAACMVGTHDFAAFANLSNDRSSTTRTLYSLKFRGNGFLHKMARHLVGVLIAVGKHRIDTLYVKRLLEEGMPDAFRTGAARGWMTAPACGLVKIDVEYPEEIQSVLSVDVP